MYAAPDPDHEDLPGGRIGDPSTIEPGTKVWTRCHALGALGGEFVLTEWGVAVPVVTAAQLAEIAIAQLVIPVPEPTMAPPPDRQLTGLRTWLHLDGWREQTATASAGGLTVTAHARPTRARWTFPDGSVTCDGPGTAWDREHDDEDPDCSIVPITATFTRPVDHDTATVVVSWERWWTSSDGDGEALAPLDRATTLAVRILEYQVTTG